MDIFLPFHAKFSRLTTHAMIFGIELSTWWFLVVGAVFSGYATLDDFDLGAGALHLFSEKKKAAASP